MSGFSPEWLALREPADHNARSAWLRDQLAKRVETREELHVTDIGCGTGSNLRALAPYLSGRQKWRLVDYDPALLEAASAALSRWADSARDEDGALQLARNGKTITVSFERVDLASDLESLLDRKSDLVTAAAFFDLVSAGWIARFAAALATRRLPLFTVLTYDGVERWTPSHSTDDAVLRAFHAHQATDKGFGAAAGPEAIAALRDALTGAGYDVALAPSPWRLEAGNARALMDQLADGIAGAVAETGLVPAQDLAAWRHARRSAQACAIGHADLLAFPRP
jgi:SAM-dependent methyltransferase